MRFRILPEWWRHGEPSKSEAELAFWQLRAAAEGELGNGHYERLFTLMFGLPREHFAGKRLLDIGCGPRGSLEWADDALERVGLDPLVDRYRGLGIGRHAMTYVAAPAEQIPFADGHFDIVSSLNSLDHVDDLDASRAEIARVLRPGGDLLLEVEIGHAATATEPHDLWFDLLEDLAPTFEVLEQRAYELPPGHWVHAAWEDAVPFDRSRGRHAGVLVARLSRRP